VNRTDIVLAFRRRPLTARQVQARLALMLLGGMIGAAVYLAGPAKADITQTVCQAESLGTTREQVIALLTQPGSRMSDFQARWLVIQAEEQCP
jgi:hypothetical protein